MNDCIKIDFTFPKPYEQFNQQNYRAKRREAWRGKERKECPNTEQDEATDENSGMDLAVAHILKGRHEELNKLLKSSTHEHLLTTTRLEVFVKISRKTLNLQGKRRITAQIRLLHFAVLKRRHKCLQVMLKLLENDKKQILKFILEPIPVLVDLQEIQKENFNEEVG